MLVVTLGLPGSASTWLLNLVKGLLQAVRPGAVAVFAETSDRFAEVVPAGVKDAVIKAHSLDRALSRLAELGAMTIVVTVRDPRDGVLSLVERFSRPYPDLIRDMTRSLATIGTLAQTLPLLVLRYEDGFTSDIGTIDLLARHLGIAVPDDVRKQLFEGLRHETIQPAVIAAPQTTADTSGVGRVRVSVAGVETFWHPNHIGDALSGKWRDRVPAPWRGVLGGCFDVFAVDPVAPPSGTIVWRPELFVVPDDRACADAGRLAWPCSGPPGMIVFGPYLSLPRGRWKIRMRVCLSGLRGTAGFRFDVVAREVLAETVSTVSADGEMHVELIVDHRHHDIPVESRIQLEHPAKHGDVELLGADVDWIGRSAI